MENTNTHSDDSCDVTGPESGPYQISIQKFVLAVIPKIFSVDGRVSVSILLTDDDEIQRLNEEFRNVGSPTDVLSFEDGLMSPDGVYYAGEIAVSVPYAKRTKDDRSLEQYILFLITHGLLHLSGTHHETEEERENVIEIGEKILREYNESHS